MVKKLWFKRKCYGWGWYPCSWEGLIVLFIWAVLFVLSISTLDNEWLKNLIVIWFITGILIGVCYKKGEKPKWSWGK